MVSFLDAATGAIRRAYCSATNRLGVYSELYLGSDNPLGASALGAANFLHNAACDRPPPNALTPPFTGGQCDGVTYNVSGRANYAGTAIPGGIAISGLAIGPVSGLTSVNTPPNTTQVYALGKATTSNPTGRYGIATLNTDFGGGNTFTSATLLSTSRQDGSPDTCGNPPGVRPPYTPGDNEIADNITYVNNEGNTITVPVVIALGYAKVDVNGTLTIPFTLNAPITPVFNISGNINLGNGGVDFDGGNPSLPPRSCGHNSDDVSPDPDDVVPDSPGNPDVPDPTNSSDPPQTRKLMVGALVTVTQVPPQVTTIPQGDNPDVYAPDVGVIAFKLSVGGTVGWTEDIRIKNARQIVPCPWDGGAIGVSGTPRTNGNFTITPLYEKRTLGQTYPQ